MLRLCRTQINSALNHPQLTIDVLVSFSESTYINSSKFSPCDNTTNFNVPVLMLKVEIKLCRSRMHSIVSSKRLPSNSQDSYQLVSTKEFKNPLIPSDWKDAKIFFCFFLENFISNFTQTVFGLYLLIIIYRLVVVFFHSLISLNDVLNK